LSSNSLQQSHHSLSSYSTPFNNIDVLSQLDTAHFGRVPTVLIKSQVFSAVSVQECSLVSHKEEKFSWEIAPFEKTNSVVILLEIGAAFFESQQTRIVLVHIDFANYLTI